MMIEVNLLPAELRRVEHTPLPRFLVIIAGTAAIMATAAFGVVVNLRTVPDLDAKQANLGRDISGCTAAAAVWDTLQDEIADVRARKQAIAEVWRTRILWSEKLTQLAQMTPTYVGLQAVRLEETHGVTRPGEPESGGTLTLESVCAGADLDRVAQWRRIAEGKVRLVSAGNADIGRYFSSSFLDLLPTETTKVKSKEEYVEPESLKFALRIPLKPPATRLEEAVKAATEEMNKQRTEEYQKSQTGAPVRTSTPAKPGAGINPATPPAPAATGKGSVSTSGRTKSPATVGVVATGGAN